MDENIKNTVEDEKVEEIVDVTHKEEIPEEEPKKKKFSIKKVAKTIAVFGAGLVTGVLLGGKKEDKTDGYYCPDYLEPTVRDVEPETIEVTED